MKKIYLVVALLAFVLMSATAIAQKADKELCLSAYSDNADVTSTHILSYTGLSNGHVIFYGETCYVIPARVGAPESVDCLPVTGSGILYENKIEIAVQGAEYTTDFGPGIFTSGQTHFSISIPAMTGTYASLSVNYIEGEKFQEFDNGTVTAVKCPAVSKSEIDADKQFKKLIDQLDKLGNVE